MSTVHASQAPAHAAAAPARPSSAGQPQPPADLFAQLLADLQAGGVQAGGDGTLTGAPEEGAAAVADGDGEPRAADERPEPQTSAAAPWLPWTVAAPAATAHMAKGSDDTPRISTGGHDARPSVEATHLPQPSAADRPPEEIEITQLPQPSATDRPRDDAIETTALPPSPTPRSKGREKADRASRAALGAAGAPAADAPRSEQAWAALREAATQAGQAHGLRTLAAAAATDGTPPATTGSATTQAPSPLEKGGAGSGQPPLGGQAGHAAATGPGTANPAAAEPSEPAGAFGLQLQEALQQTLETVGAQVALWQAGRAQHASLSFEDGWDDPLAVDVRLDDGVAHLSFRTDDAAARQLIQAQAPQALAEALARAGLALGQLDVGARGQGDGAAPPRAARRLTLDGALDGAKALTADVAAAARPVHRGTLDVYA